VAATEIIAPLSAEEQHSLASLEMIVDQGLDAFLAVGQALAIINDEVHPLWRPAWKTFENYLTDRYPKMCRSRAYHAIRHAKVYENLSTFVDVSNLKESHTRALAGFTPHLHAEIMVKAKELSLEKGGSGDISAPMINRAGILVYEAKKQPSPNDRDEMEADGDKGDETDVVVPVPRAAALAGAADRTAPARVHPAIRAAEHHRLGRKDSGKIVADDLKDPAIQGVVDKMILALGIELHRLRELVSGQ
jgi:hypothetical protein